MLQYFEFLISNVDKDSYPSLFTDFQELAIKFGLEAEVSFMILRPKLNRLIKVFSFACVLRLIF